MSPRARNSDIDIFEATLDVIAEHGVSRATVDMVAARAGMSKATIYRHWGSRAQLIHAALSSLEGPYVETPATRCGRTSRSCSRTSSPTSTDPKSFGSSRHSSTPR